MKVVSFLSAAALAFLAVGCNNDEATSFPINESISFENKSIEPAFVKPMAGFENIGISTLISSTDVLPQSPEFVYAGQPDGSGLFKDYANDGYIMLTNHEITKSISRVYLDKNFRPVKGEYILDGLGGLTRLCSATLATPYEHGFSAFLTAGESGEESMVHAISPDAPVSRKSDPSRVKPALGKASMENAVPLPKDITGGKTMIVIGEDQGYSISHKSAGQVLMYVGNMGDLDNGKLYSLKRTNGDVTETNMTKGNSYDVDFVEIPNAKNLTGAEINQKNIDLGVIRFSRVEDLDYRKGAGNGNEIYFTATGQSSDGVNPVPGFTMWGRIYRLELDKNNMMKGKLSLVAEGDSNPGMDLINPDNIVVTNNYVYIQEDGDSYYTNAKHDSYVWQYNIGSGSYKPFINMKHERGNAQWNAAYNQSNQLQKFGSWEYGAMADVSELVGVPGTFILNIHSHTWQSPKFKNADGAGVNTNLEGGQTVLLRNVPR